jgi:hypothetical protein
MAAPAGIFPPPVRKGDVMRPDSKREERRKSNGRDARQSDGAKRGSRSVARARRYRAEQLAEWREFEEHLDTTDDYIEELKPRE